MADSPPYFSLYPRDFVGDDLVQGMSTQELGAYFLLLCSAWQSDPPASIPNDDLILARITRLDAEVWAGCRTRVLGPFKLGTDNRWHQKRLRKEYDKAVALIKSRSKGGKMTGEKNREKASLARCSALAEHDAKTVLIGSGSESDSPSLMSSQADGADLPRDGPDGITWACRLTVEWVTYFRGTQRSERDHEKLDGFFQSLLDRGVKPEDVLEQIKHKGRLKTMPTWEFEKCFFPAPTAHSKGKPTAADFIRKVREEREQREREKNA